MGLAIGMAVTVFGYDNRASVNVHWLIFHIDGIPLWAVAVVPLALFLIAGTLYHWADGLHHFTEHMRHRRRVHELEAEVASLRAHMDHVLEMPDHSTSRLPARTTSTASLPAAAAGITDLDGAGESEAEPTPAEPTVQPQSAVERAAGEEPTAKRSRSSQRKRVTLEVEGEGRRTDRSGSHVEGMIGNEKTSEPANDPEPEA